jgi:kinetochore protein Nuf2
MSSRQQQYSFPILKNRSILDCLSELEMPLTMEQLKNPESKQMTEIYEQFVYLLMGVSREELRQPVLSALDTLEYRELHDDSVTEVTLTRHILQLMRCVGIHDASMRDFVTPQAARTKRILSAIINFAKFREERLGTYEQFTEQVEELVELKHQLEHDNAQLKGQLEQLQDKRDIDMPIIEELTIETDQLKKDIQELNSKHSSLRDEIHTVKASINDHNDQTAKHNFELLESKQKNDKLRKQIVKSPEKLKASISNMSSLVTNNKTTLTQANATLRQHQHRHTALNNVHDSLDKQNTLLQQCQEDIQKHKKLRDQIESAVSRATKEKNAIRQTAATEQHLRKQISSGQEKLFRLQEKFEKKRHASQMALDEVQSNRMTLMRDNAKQRTKIESNEALAEQRRQEIQATQAQHQRQMNQLRTKYSSLGDQVKAYHHRLLQAMGMIAAH